MAVAQMRTTPPKQLMTTVIIGIQSAENKTGANENTTEIPATSDDDGNGIDEDLRRALTVMLAHEFQQTTTIPLPTTAQWQDSTANDWDLNKLAHAIKDGRELQRDEIENATLYKLWSQQKVRRGTRHLVPHGERRHTESKAHLRTRIPPPKLRQAIFSALHVAPMAGHTGYQKTFWKIAARYYWPNMATDIKQLTLGCGHCNAANITSHEAQQQLAAFQADEPFDVITLDVWHPGRAAMVKKGNGTHVVTCIDTMTGFAAATFVNALDSETMTRSSIHIILHQPRLTKTSHHRFRQRIRRSHANTVPKYWTPELHGQQRQPQSHYMREVSSIFKQGSKNPRRRLRNIPRFHVRHHISRCTPGTPPQWMGQTLCDHMQP